jgi:hypothetical protein
MINLEGYSSVPYTWDKNDWGFPNILSDYEEFNRILECASLQGEIKSTTGGHISESGLMIGKYCRLNKNSTNSFEFILVEKGRIYRFILKPEQLDEIFTKEGRKYTGSDALKVLRTECKTILEPFALLTNKDVAEVKNRIPKPMIYLTNMGEYTRGRTITNAFHMDINSAFPAGVVATYPAFRHFFEKHYKLRNEDPLHKAIMNFSIGASQSLKIRGYRYPELARAGIDWTNRKLLDLTQKLEDKGYCVLGYNTDGIFVLRKKGMPIYTDEDEGTELGQWKISHVFDKLRFKSAGSYEYVENGIYKPVVRGKTTLEKTKPREQWEWGDIFQAELIGYYWDPISNQVREVVIDG